MLHNLSGPHEAEIQRVMTETGMQYHAARNHLIGRKLMIERVERERSLRAWGAAGVSSVTQVQHTF